MLGGEIGDLEAGDEFEPVEYVLTSAHCSEYAHGHEQGSELFHSEFNPLGRQIRPPTMIHTDKMRLLSLNCPKERRFAGQQAKDARIHYEYHAQHHSLAYVGDRLIVSGRITDRYVRRGREFISYQLEVKTAEGRLVTSYTDKTLLRYKKVEA